MTTAAERRGGSVTTARMLFFAALAFALSPASVRAQTILNVERLQPGDVQGWHYGVEGEFSVARGNDEYFDVLAGVAVGHRWPDDWLRVFLGLDYRSETGEGLDNDRYLHARYNHWWAARWQSFHFVQMQASKSNLLRSRTLLGSGVRHRLVDGRTTFDVGTGAMYERENLDGAGVTDDHALHSRVWRMANLVVATRRLSETVRLIGVGYVQPQLDEFDDLRLLADLSIQIALTENVDLTIRGDWRRDTRPPGGTERDDVVLRTGFTLSFD